MARSSLVITGASRGIGLEFVRQYLDAGWRVHATCRQPDQCAPLLNLAASHRDLLNLHPLDVSDAHQISALATKLRDQPVDLLINNAGVLGPRLQGLGQIHPQAWLDTFAVNAIAPLLMVESLLDNLLAGGLRLVANVTSKMGSIQDNDSGGFYIYRSSKVALNMVVKSASIDLAERGVRLVLLHPGWVKTSMGGPNAELEVADSVSRMRAILERVGPDDSGRFFDIDGSTIPW